ncbi:serine hydrolase family protein [Roseateles oligotrophus]|uniref:Uncharacterized protein n=1 Tax=Roseateles oligotrophus TaxID=1769250 RepID=A0ABT2YHR1_9BURK|nr:hypothetical protein [Roseateles oligotrophus]MCV2369591.1 hypothetical protein [Roseateles oligotrophus]
MGSKSLDIAIGASVYLGGRWLSPSIVESGIPIASVSVVLHPNKTLSKGLAMFLRSKLAIAALLASCLISNNVAMAAGQFDTLTGLAQGAVAGTNVGSAVSGFELLVLQGGQSIYHQSFGVWTQGQNAGIDSSTKTISGALMMSVTDTHSNFTLDTKLSALLPSFQAVVDKRDITVR